MSSIAALSYGVQYTITSQHHQHRITIDSLTSIGIRYIRITWVDFTKIVRFHVVPIALFARILASPRPSISMIRGALGVFSIQLADGFITTGEYLYVPDLDSLRVCPYAPGHASVMGWYEEKVPVPSSDGTLTLKVDVCPRATLKRVSE
jgi:glutamine synthetase